MLTKKSINGDIDQFEKRVSEYNRYVYNIAYRMMGNQQDAEDMAQESLIKAYRKIDTFREDANFSTWLYRIVINTCKDELRKRKEKVLSLDDEDGVKNIVASEVDDPLIVYEKNEVKERVQSAIDQLSEDYKSVIVLRELMGYSYDEMSTILDVPIGTIRSRLSRSRQALKLLLKADY